MQPEGGALIQLKWADMDSGHYTGASERLIAEVARIDDYAWLMPLITKHFGEKYCNQCSKAFDDCAKDHKTKPFPYCFNKSVEPIPFGTINLKTGRVTEIAPMPKQDSLANEPAPAVNVAPNKE